MTPTNRQDQFADLLQEIFTPVISKMSKSKKDIPDINLFILNNIDAEEYFAERPLTRRIVGFVLKVYGYQNTYGNEWRILEKDDEEYYKKEYFRLKAGGLITLSD